MRNGSLLQGRVRPVAAGMMVLLFSAGAAHATVHVVKFGGSLGNAYDPSALSVAVGDTVQWQGSFSFHPLSSTSIPAGAATWHNASGTVFSYLVTLPGMYNYQCDVHEPAMVGSFNATLASVGANAGFEGPTRISLDQNYPNPFNPETRIGYRVEGLGSSVVKLGVYDLLGREVAVLVDGVKPAGSYVATFDATRFGSGLYVYKLTAGATSLARSMVLIK